MGNNVKLTWHTEKRRLGDLIEWDKNPRQLKEHDAEHLKKSLDNFGVADPLIINTDNRIIGGHMRRRIMLQSGYKPDDLVDVRVPERELTEREAEELAIRLNKNTGDWDFDALANNFELDDLLDWGFDKQELDLDLWAGEPPEDVEPQIDKAEELREKWGVESGQLWQLGEHRLVCGDCTDKAVVDKVMQGERADVIFTDPPYGISREGIANDDLVGEEFDLFNAKWVGEIQAEDNALFICYHSTRTFPSALNQVTSYGWNFERMLWFYRPDKFPAHTWKGWMMVSQAIMLFSKGDAKYLEVSPADQDTYRCTVKDLGGGSGHPTEKIVGQCESVMNHLSGGIVYEPFLGSGTTLIACERLGRKCRAVEISPAYCAVAIQRWVDVTNGTPELVN
jgi:DNA modification methylase